MAKVRILVDTDVLIDYLKRVRPARELLLAKGIDSYCSVLSKKELLSKPGLSAAERNKVLEMLGKIKVMNIDREINESYMRLLEKYGDRRASLPDYIVAATAWAKNLPLLTRNTKHFKHIGEITLAPSYSVDDD